MAEAKGEVHGCIVCGKLYQLYAVHDSEGNYIGSRVMTPGGKEVKGYGRPLVACDKHSAQEINRAVERVYGPQRVEQEEEE
jgi:hypothetical protein